MRAITTIHGNKPSYWAGDGFRIQTLVNHLCPEAHFNYQHTDPFLLLDYGDPTYFPPNPQYDTQPRGIGQHPHKGFEAVTIACSGEVSHKDSSGGHGIIREGDMQWMTVGRGITHEEFHSPAFGQHGGMFSMLQMWVNLPQQHKLTAANYQAFERATIPTTPLYANDINANKAAHDLNNQTPIGNVRIIAGTLNDITGAVQTFTPSNVWDIELQSSGTATLAVPTSHNLMIVVQEGTALINDVEVSAGQLVQFVAPSAAPSEEAQPKNSKTAMDTITLTYPQPSELAENAPTIKLVLLSGEPIGEPIAAHGPFVMTTQQELKQTFLEYQHGNFG